MKVKKSLWLPVIITIYFLFMAIYFGRELLTTGKWLEFILICGGEILIIVLLVIFLRKRERF